MAAQQSGISAALQPVLRLSEWFIGCDKTHVKCAIRRAVKVIRRLACVGRYHRKKQQLYIYTYT